MTHQEREEIERILHGILDAQRGLSVSSFNESYLKPLMNFARKQLNLRVDGERMDEWLRNWYKGCEANPTPEEWQSIVLERLTTDPLPTEQKED